MLFRSQVEALVQQMVHDSGRGGKTEGGRSESKLDANTKAAVDQLERALGTRVRIVPLSDQRGRIEIEYYSQTELDRLFQHITGSN